MNNYSVGASVPLSIPLTDLNGAAVTPTGLSYRVLNGEGVELQGATSVTLPATPTPPATWPPATFTVPGSANTAAGVRAVELTIITAAGTIVKETAYMVRGAARLAVMVNSFQTYAHALALIDELPDMLAISAATETKKVNALVEAFECLRRMSYVITAYDGEEMNRVFLITDPTRITPAMWREMTEADFLTYPAAFVAALRKAQVAEANAIVTGNPIADKRRAGLMSESIGESSMMFRPGTRPLELPVARATMKYLVGYAAPFNNRIGRA